MAKVDDAKREYLVRTFSRTKRKDYENYILNAIWHKLDRSDIQPVTQQFIKRSDGKYALVDLYFPQLGIGVECDEFHHTKNAEKDLDRTLTMEEMLSVYDETKDFKLYRIEAYKGIEHIEKKINDVVKAIKNKIQRKNPPAWNFDEDPYKVALKKGCIHIKDRLAFGKIVDICRCFGRNPKRMQQAYFYIGQGCQLWCPKLAVADADGKPRSVARGWVNTLSEDWENIFEKNDDPEKMLSLDKTSRMRPRITFAKSTDILGRKAYRFIGVYKLDPKASKRKRVYKRIAQSIDLTLWKG
ncbi:MAG: hypothetical protein FWF24_05225 [Alphaproteobacteria bacterium]|nr:hypothetical protein [Alphaproteobacteria bacterium]